MGLILIVVGVNIIRGVIGRMGLFFVFYLFLMKLG